MNKPPSKEMMGMAGAAMLERKRREALARAGATGTTRRGRVMRAVFSSFPLLLFPVLMYNLMAFVFGGSAEPLVTEGGKAISPMLASLDNVLFTVPMISDVNWAVTSGDALLLFAVSMLFLEILKATSTGTSTIFNHALSMLIFIVCLVEFLLFPQFATSVFFILTMMTLLDVLAGVMVTIVSARRDFAVGEGFGG